MHGDELARQLAGEGVDTSLLVRRSDVSTSLAVPLAFLRAGGFSAPSLNLR